MVKPTLSKQDARATILDLNQYDSNDMINDLGNHRHTELPLSGKPVNLAPPPPPNAKKFGVATARLAAKNDAIASAWGALYDPGLDEERDDGLGTGQAHRMGENFRPNINVLSGRGGFGGGGGGKPRRARSLSPRGRAGRGRGLVEPGNLASRMGVAQQPRASIPNFTPTKFDPKMRVVKPRVSTRALDDMAAAQNNAFGTWKAYDAPRPPRAPIKADAKDKDVGHWWGGRLAINQDKMDYFSANRALQKAVAVESAASAESRGRSTLSDAAIRVAQKCMGVPKLNGLEASRHAPLSHAKSNASLKSHQSNGLGASKYAPGADDDDWVRAPPPVSKAENHSNPLNSAPKTPQSQTDFSPFSSPGSSRFNKDPATEEEFQAMVEEYEDRVGSAQVLLNVHIEELSKASDQVDILTEKLSEAVKVKEAKEEIAQKTRHAIAQKKAMLNQLRQRQTKFIAEQARVRAEAEEKEKQAKSALEAAQRSVQEELDRENQRQEQEKKNAEAHKLQDEFIKAQLLRSEIFKAQLAQEQAEKKEAQRLEKERLEKERLEKERLEQEHIKKERIEKERNAKKRLGKKLIEKERIEKERIEIERLGKERLDQQKQLSLEQERLYKQRIAIERAKKELLQERLDNDRLDIEKLRAAKEVQYQQQQAQQLEERRRADDLAKQMADLAELASKQQEQHGPNQAAQAWQDSAKLYELEKKNHAEVERMEKERAERKRAALEAVENQKQEKAAAALRQIERIKRLHQGKADSIFDGPGGLEASKHAPQELLRPKSPAPQSVTLPFRLPTPKYAPSSGPTHISRPGTPLPSIQATTPERVTVTIKPAIVFNKDKNPTLHTLAFAAANPISGIPPMTGYPYQARIIIRPIFDVDAVTVTLSSTDQPGGKIRRTLNGLLGEEDAQYLFGLPSVKEYILALTDTFYGRVPAMFNAQF